MAPLADINVAAAVGFWITTIKDLLLAGASGVAIYVGLKGLHTWRRQLEGSTEYELARRILLAALRTRDQLRQVRNAVIWASEMDEPQGAGANRQSVAPAYEKRWRRAADARTSLDAERVEAEVLRGANFPDCFSELNHVMTELLIALQQYLDVERHPRTDSAEWRQIRDTVFGRPGDAYEKSLLAAIGKIEAAVRPHLGHRR